MSKATDLDILSAIQSGDNQYVLSSLYKTVLPMVKKLIMSNSGNEEEAKDIFQDAVLIFYNQVKEGRFDSRYEIGGFIYSVSRNLWINRAKRLNRTTRMNTEATVPVHENVLDDLITEEKSYAINALLDKIGEECKKLLKYSTYEKLSMKEICEKMGFSNENVAKTNNYRCKQKLISLVKDNKSIIELFKA